jgi:hypothetical protein
MAYMTSVQIAAIHNNMHHSRRIFPHHLSPAVGGHWAGLTRSRGREGRDDATSNRTLANKNFAYGPEPLRPPGSRHLVPEIHDLDLAGTVRCLTWMRFLRAGFRRIVEGWEDHGLCGERGKGVYLFEGQDGRSDSYSAFVLRSRNNKSAGGTSGPGAKAARRYRQSS